MKQHQKALIVLIVAVLGIWGCAQGPSASAEKLKAIESRVARLEDDLKAATAARDQYRKKLAETETLAGQLQGDLDETRTQLKARTGERDDLTQQFETFRKTIKDLIGQTEAALAKPKTPVTTVSQPKTPKL